jgi:ABC-type phosphate transport system auxiliary subunit
MADSPRTPRKYKASPISVSRAAHTISSGSKMLEDALSIIDQQIERMRIKSGSVQLDEKEARVLMGYVKSLVEISREEREREKTDKIVKEVESLSTKELLERAAKELKD